MRLQEQRQDAVHAASHYALGRTLYEQGDLTGALDAYLRSFQWDASQHSLLDEIVPLAASLGRESLAIRYALLMADREVATPEMLRRLALHATEQQQWRRAGQLYDRWLARSDGSRNPLEDALIRLERGRLAAADGDLEAASRWFEEPQQAMLTDPGSPLARKLTSALGGAATTTLESFIRCHLAAGRPRLARQALDAYAEQPGAVDRLGYWSAEHALAVQEPLEAHSHIEEHLATGDHSLGELPFETLKRTLVRLNRRELVEAELRDLVSQQPTNPFPLATLAAWLDQQGDRHAAEREYRRLLDGAQTDSPLILTRELFVKAGEWLLGRHIERSQWDATIALLSELAGTDPLLSFFADTLKRRLGEDAEQSLGARLAAMLQAQQLDAADAASGFRLGMTLKQFETAQQFATLLLDATQENQRDTAVAIAVELVLAGQHSIAAQLLDEAIATGTVPQGDAVAWYYLSTAKAMSGAMDEALAAARRAEELTPDSADFAMHIAWVLQRAGRGEAAIAQYYEVLDRFAAETDSATNQLLQEARKSLSYLVLRQGDRRLAAELLQRVLDHDPTEIGALNDLGYQWADEGVHLRRSVRMIRQAVQAEPDNPAYLDSLGWAHYRLGNLQAALDAIEQALGLQRRAGDPADPEILTHYGDVLAALGRGEQAVTTWQDALHLVDPDDDPAGIASRLREKIAPAAERASGVRTLQETSQETP